MKTLLRSASIVALASFAFVAQAQVTYRLLGRLESFSLVTNTYLVSDARFDASALGSGTVGVRSVLFLPSDRFNADELNVEGLFGTNFYYFPLGSFAANGVYTGDSAGVEGTLTVSGQPVPEPASLAALGLGALAMLRRRKRA